MTYDANLKEIFTNIYQNWGFGGYPESRSGPGSTLGETESIRKEIRKLVENRNIKSIVDIPCGDFNWMKEIVYGFEKYTGGDIVPDVIAANQKYANDVINFIHFDLTGDVEIPEADLLIVRDVIGHLPLETGKRVIKNILNSKCKYLLSTTWYNVNDSQYYKRHAENREVDVGRFYPVCLSSEPFNLPIPELYFEEQVIVSDYELGNRKGLGFWNLDDVRKTLKQNIETTTSPIIQKETDKVIENIFNNITNVNNKELLLQWLDKTKQLIESVKPDHSFHTINSSNFGKSEMTENLTIVTGLWNINRTGRDFSHYIENFKKFLDIPVKMFIHLPKEFEYLVWENKHRTKENTYIRIFELETIKNNLYTPFWEKTQNMRTDPEWLEQTGKNGWLKNSPQAVNEWYNPIVQSKMFMLHDAKLMNPFNTDYFVWLDAAITNTVYEKYFTENRCLDKLIPHLKTFLFLSYPYEASGEIHGFDFKAINRYARQEVKYVCRGGLFGGHKDFLSQANSTYYSLLDRSLSEGYMGTEESIFSIMAHLEPHIYRRYALDGNGLIVKFIQALLDDSVELEDNGTRTHVLPKGTYNESTDKTSLYVLSFNFPEQFQTLIDSFEKQPEWLQKPRKVLINNSEDTSVIEQYESICQKYNFEHIVTGENLGINRGRLFAAKHFQESDSDYYFFFEDDMCLHEPENKGHCRNGFRHYVPNLYKTVHEIMAREEFDFLKLSFTEVYMDNNIQVSWYNVPQTIRTSLWPTYDQLPVSGLDPYAPRTKFDRIDVQSGLSYISGEIYYANWPMIVNKNGNYKMFLETDWAHPYEQTWMSYMFQETLKGNIKPAVLLAAPINHNRIFHYGKETRREN